MKRNNHSICFVLPHWFTKGIGGAELQCYLLSEEYIKRGWKVEVLVRKHPIDFPQYINPKIKYHYYHHSKIKIISFLNIFFKLLKTQSKWYYNRTDSRLMRGANKWYNYFAGTKTVYALANDMEVRRRSYIAENKESNTNLIKILIHKLDDSLVDLLVANSGKKAEIVVSQTYFQQKGLLKYQKIPSTVIRNSFLNGHEGETPKEDIIIWVGNFKTIKHPEIFMELADRFQQSHYKFIMIGDTFKRENEFIHVKNPNFKILGKLNQQATIEWIAKAKCIVSTSKGEGFSNVFIQAWTNKTALVSLSVDPDHLISQDGYGIYCEESNEKLFHVIQSIINTGVDSTMVDRSFKFSQNEFDLTKNINKLTELIEAKQ